MLRDNIQDLVAFVAVVEAGSFTRAAAKLGISQPALSQVIRNLESRLGVRLFARTTRKVANTEAGERLFNLVQPRLIGLESDLTELNEWREKPTGKFRITSVEYAAETILLPKLAGLLSEYPDISVEIEIDYGLTDIVSQQFDGGVRSGEQIEKDMIAVRIGPDITMAVFAVPAYFERYGIPLNPYEVTRHNCINLRLPTRGCLYAWEFKKDTSSLNVNVRGQLVVNNASQVVQAALCGFGLAMAPRELVTPYLENGQLKEVLSDWCSPFSGFHLYYPNRHQSSRAFRLVVDALRYSG